MMSSPRARPWKRFFGSEHRIRSCCDEVQIGGVARRLTRTLGVATRSMATVAQFLAKCSPEIAEQLQAARKHLSGHFPRGFELVYDNYNALVFGFGPSERASEAILSVAGYPKWVTLFFLRGAGLPDPHKRLEGTGSQVRSVRLAPLQVLEEPAVQALILAAIANAASDLRSAPPLQTVIKSVSAKQRPRRPPAAKQAKSGAKTTRRTSRES